MLFKDRDENLPLLTRWYQLALPQGWREDPMRLAKSELDEFLFVESALLRQRHPERRFFSEAWVECDLEMGVNKTLLPLARLHRSMVYLMDLVVDGKESEPWVGAKVALDPEHPLNEFRAMQDFFSNPPRFAIWRGEKDKTTVTVTRTINSLGARIITDFIESVDEKGNLTRCPECCSVYPKSARPGAKWCSFRCGNRVSQRVRFRRKKSEELVEV